MDDAEYLYDTFISYSHVDREWVSRWLLPRLEAAGLRVCIDSRFEIGIPSLVNMERAVDHSRHTLLVLTPAWVESGWTNFEQLLTQTSDPAARRRRLLPLLLRPCQPPLRIAMLAYADFTQEANREAEFQRVLKALKGELSLPEVGPHLTEMGPLAASVLIGLPQQPWRPGISPPGALLRADIDGAVPFHGRHDEVASIETWCDTAEPIGVRLYTGAGGMGKTRLFIEMCQRFRARRWRAGFLDHRAAAPAAIWSKLVNHPDPLFLVLDYAETRREELTTLLREVFKVGTEPRVRIVLLARTADDWWDQLKTEREGVGDLLTGPATQRFSLGPLALTTEDRCRSYRMALTTFGDRLKPEKPPSDDPPEDIGSKIFERVLLLHMSALAAIDGVPVKGDQGILDYVLQRERRFWSEMAEAKGLSPDIVPGIAQAMAVLTLGGGARTRAEAVAVFKQISLLKDQRAAVLNGISMLLHETYPGEKWIEPILPDLLGEHLVQVEVKKDPDALFNLVFGAREVGTVVSPEH